MSELIIALERVVNDEPRECDVLMPVANEKCVVVTTELSLASVCLESAAHDRSKSSDNSVASFSTQTVTVSEQIPMTEDIKWAVGHFRYFKLDMLAVPEIARDAAVHIPLV